MNTIPNPKKENSANDQRKLKISATYPIKGGPNKNPK